MYLWRKGPVHCNTYTYTLPYVPLEEGPQSPDLPLPHEEPQPGHDVQDVARGSKLLELVLACHHALHEVGVVPQVVVVTVAQLVHHAAHGHPQSLARPHHATVGLRLSQQFPHHRVHLIVHDVFQRHLAGVGVGVQGVPDDLAELLPSVVEHPKGQTESLLVYLSDGEGGPAGKVVSLDHQRLLDGLSATHHNSRPAAHGDVDDVTVLLAHAREGDGRSLAEEGEITEERESPGSRR